MSYSRSGVSGNGDRRCHRCRTFAIEHCNRAALVRLDILTYLFNFLLSWGRLRSRDRNSKSLSVFLIRTVSNVPQPPQKERFGWIREKHPGGNRFPSRAIYFILED
ncbi:hypothetical protein [Roseofilum casamattae]|uniref:Uncharacterized protein n=1 Tax=Roseofilum casamattae BLCC-M143 TaxID=3022442 RepID=A0ABT7BYN5_9CYAN|nr:hypothetical protein [Roseofilum casamattae]MDJ1184319.1 hypothetical protein [Roseofilum casamattae BLCC-M143]